MTKDYKWEFLQTADSEKVDCIAAEVGIDKVLAGLLVNRGIDSFEKARSFFRPNLNDLHDPFLMKDMDVAVERLHRAIEQRESILVYGDYDVDGTTAVSLMYSFIRRFTNKVDFYIPDRYNEGYGISIKGIDTAISKNCKLIITLDCGIKALDKIEYAQSKGVDVIVCDHHLPAETLPKAIAVLDPKREDCNYPFDDLSGCGVGFKLAQAYSIKYGIEFESLVPLLDLLVVSIVSDLVSMVDENRIFAHFGLKQLNTSPCHGLKALIELCKLEQGHITVDDIVFKIGPRINAAGRMDSGGHAVELLTALNMEKAAKLGEKINKNNNDRKEVDREITKEALEMVQNGTCLSKENVTIVYDPKWNKGVVGIVASRLVEAFYKPAVVLTKSNDFITGSARSIGGFDLYEAIESCSDLLENFGGHVYAAGLTMKAENLQEFTRRLDAYVEAHITKESLIPVISVDAKINFEDISPKFFRILKLFQPFGPGNLNPVFVTENVYDKGTGRKVGAGGLHLKLDLIQESQPYHSLPTIGFNLSDFHDYICEGNPFDICYSIVENFYRGNSSIQLRLKDLHPREDILPNFKTS